MKGIHINTGSTLGWGQEDEAYNHLNPRLRHRPSPEELSTNPAEAIRIASFILQQEGAHRCLSLNSLSRFFRETSAAYLSDSNLENERQQSQRNLVFVSQLLTGLSHNESYREQRQNLLAEYNRIQGFQDLENTLRSATLFFGLDNFQKMGVVISMGASVASSIGHLAGSILGVKAALGLSLISSVSNAWFQNGVQLTHAYGEGQDFSHKEIVGELADSAVAALGCGVVAYALSSIRTSSWKWTIAMFAADVGTEYLLTAASPIKRILHLQVQGFVYGVSANAYGLAANALGEFLGDKAGELAHPLSQRISVYSSPSLPFVSEGPHNDNGAPPFILNAPTAANDNSLEETIKQMPLKRAAGDGLVDAYSQPLEIENNSLRLVSVASAQDSQGPHLALCPAAFTEQDYQFHLREQSIQLITPATLEKRIEILNTIENSLDGEIPEDENLVQELLVSLKLNLSELLALPKRDLFLERQTKRIIKLLTPKIKKVKKELPGEDLEITKLLHQIKGHFVRAEKKLEQNAKEFFINNSSELKQQLDTLKEITNSKHLNTAQLFRLEEILLRSFTLFTVPNSASNLLTEIYTKSLQQLEVKNRTFLQRCENILRIYSGTSQLAPRLETLALYYLSRLSELEEVLAYSSFFYIQAYIQRIAIMQSAAAQEALALIKKWNDIKAALPSKPIKHRPEANKKKLAATAFLIGLSTYLNSGLTQAMDEATPETSDLLTLVASGNRIEEGLLALGLLALGTAAALIHKFRDHKIKAPETIGETLPVEFGQKDNKIYAFLGANELKEFALRKVHAYLHYEEGKFFLESVEPEEFDVKQGRQQRTWLKDSAGKWRALGVEEKREIKVGETFALGNILFRFRYQDEKPVLDKLITDSEMLLPLAPRQADLLNSPLRYVGPEISIPEIPEELLKLKMKQSALIVEEESDEVSAFTYAGLRHSQHDENNQDSFLIINGSQGEKYYAVFDAMGDPQLADEALARAQILFEWALDHGRNADEALDLIQRAQWKKNVTTLALSQKKAGLVMTVLEIHPQQDGTQKVYERSIGDSECFWINPAQSLENAIKHSNLIGLPAEKNYPATQTDKNEYALLEDISVQRFHPTANLAEAALGETFKLRCRNYITQNNWLAILMSDGAAEEFKDYFEFYKVLRRQFKTRERKAQHYKDALKSEILFRQALVDIFNSQSENVLTLNNSILKQAEEKVHKRFPYIELNKFLHRSDPKNPLIIFKTLHGHYCLCLQSSYEELKFLWKKTHKVSVEEKRNLIRRHVISHFKGKDDTTLIVFKAPVSLGTTLAKTTNSLSKKLGVGLAIFAGTAITGTLLYGAHSNSLLSLLSFFAFPLAMVMQINTDKDKKRRQAMCSARFIKELADSKVDLRIRKRALEAICRYLNGQSLPGDNVKKKVKRDCWSINASPKGNGGYRILFIVDENGEIVFIGFDTHVAIDNRVHYSEFESASAVRYTADDFRNELKKLAASNSEEERVDEAEEELEETDFPESKDSLENSVEEIEPTVPEISISTEISIPEAPLNISAEELLDSVKVFWELDLFSNPEKDALVNKLLQIQTLLQEKQIFPSLLVEVELVTSFLDDPYFLEQAKNIFDLYAEVRPQILASLHPQEILKTYPELTLLTPVKNISIEMLQERALRLFSLARHHGLLKSDLPYRELISEWASCKEGSRNELLWTRLLEEAGKRYIKHRAQILECLQTDSKNLNETTFETYSKSLEEEFENIKSRYIEFALIKDQRRAEHIDAMIGGQLQSLFLEQRDDFRVKLKDFWSQNSLCLISKMIAYSEYRTSRVFSQRLSNYSEELGYLIQEINLRLLAGENFFNLSKQCRKKLEALYQKYRGIILDSLLSETKSVEGIVLACSEFTIGTAKHPWSHLQGPAYDRDQLNIICFPEWILISSIHKVYQKKATEDELRQFENRIQKLLFKKLKEGISYAEIRNLAENECKNLAKEYLLKREELLSREDVNRQDLATRALTDTELDQLFFELREIDFCARDPEIEEEIKQGLLRHQNKAHAHESIIIQGNKIYLLPTKEISEIIKANKEGKSYNKFDLNLTPETDLKTLRVVYMIPFNVDFVGAPPLAFRLMSFVAFADTKNATKHNQENVAHALLWMAAAILMGFEETWVRAKGAEIILQNYKKLRTELLPKIDWLKIAAEKNELRPKSTEMPLQANKPNNIFLKILNILNTPEARAVFSRNNISTQAFDFTTPRTKKFTGIDQQNIARFYLQYREEIQREISKEKKAEEKVG